MNGKIVVVGSYNVGLFLYGRSIPRVGETLIGHRFCEGGGGKGSNQAIAAALMGGDVTLIGRIGADGYGRDALSMYRRLGVSTEWIVEDPSIHSGISVIFVDEAGNNSIMVVPGANDHLAPADIDRAQAQLREAAYVGFQLENSLDTVLYGIRRAHALGARTLLDPAPAQPLPEDIYPCIDVIKPNEHEAAALTGIPVADAASAVAAGRWFLERGVGQAIITLGERGAVLVEREGEYSFRAPRLPAPAADTTGAGDCFSGALLSRLAAGCTALEAVPLALCAATLSVTREGVIDSIPSRAEAEDYCRRSGGDLLISGGRQ